MFVALLLALYHPPDRLAPAEPFDPLPQFPPHALACHHAAFADAHLQWLRDRRFLEADRADWHAHQRDAAYCADRWRALRMAREGGCDWGEWLPAEFWQDYLRDLLGDEDYAAGRMPPPVPPWHVRPDPAALP